MLITLDEKLNVKTYRHYQSLDQYILSQELELSETALTSFKNFGNELKNHISMTATEVYIGSEFYQYCKNSSDSMALFELHRNKRIGNVKFTHLLKGPVPSLDSSNLMYVTVSDS